MTFDEWFEFQFPQFEQSKEMRTVAKAAWDAAMDNPQDTLDMIVTSLELSTSIDAALTCRIEALESDRDKMRRELVIQDRLLRELRRERALHATNTGDTK